MKAVYKNLALILSLIFTLSIIGLAYYLYIFPERIANETSLISLMDIPQLQPVLTELYIFCGLSLAIGFAALLLFIFSRTSNDDSNVVYIEKFKDKEKNQSEGKQTDDKATAIDVELEEITTAVEKEEDAHKKADLLLSMLAKKLEASQGAIYKAGKEENRNIISLHASYAFVLPESQTVSYEFGEGLAGQVAKEQKLVNISDVPKGYISILSGLGEAKPAHLIICPIKKDNQLLGVAEIASFKKFTTHDEKLVESAVHLLAGSLMNIEKNKDLDKSKS